MSNEIAPGYSVTEDGKVFSSGSNWRGYGERELEQQLNSHGYPSVRIIVNGVRKRMLVHSLVAIAFLPPRPSAAHEVRHLDGNKQNNNSSNLAWGTRKENAADRELHGKTSRGPSHSSAIRRSNQAEAARSYRAKNPRKGYTLNLTEQQRKERSDRMREMRRASVSTKSEE